MSGLMSGDGKRGFMLPRPSSTLLIRRNPCSVQITFGKRKYHINTVAWDILRISGIVPNYIYVDDLPKFKVQWFMFFSRLLNHQTDQNYCRYDMDTLCLPRAVYDCQTQKPKGGKPWKSIKQQKFGSITMWQTRKKITARTYRWIINKFCADFGGEELTELPSEKILQFFNIITEGCKPQTKRVRFSHLSSFLNFMKNNLNLNFQNPCELPMLRKLFRPTVTVRWNIIEKETVDEIIFRTTNVRNRLILELMARVRMRIGEVLKFRLMISQVY